MTARNPGHPGRAGTMAQIAATTGETRRPYVPPKRVARGGRINLKAVAEVLAERGYDPTEEIINALDSVDEQGRPVLDDDVRSRINLELLQYVQPKLKSVEIRAKLASTSFDVNDDQAKRIAEEFLKAAVKEAE